MTGINNTCSISRMQSAPLELDHGERNLTAMGKEPTQIIGTAQAGFNDRRLASRPRNSKHFVANSLPGNVEGLSIPARSASKSVFESGNAAFLYSLARASCLQLGFESPTRYFVSPIESSWSDF